MKNNKVYTVAKPALKLSLLRAELGDNSIITSVSNDGINERERKEFLYSEISSINISLIDINRNQICIKSDSGNKLKLISLSLGKLKDGKIYRETVNQATEFNDWISEFHKILIDKKLTEKIEFSEGSSGKLAILILLIAVCVIGTIPAISIGKTGLAFTLLSGTIICGVLFFKMGLKRKYEPGSKII